MSESSPVEGTQLDLEEVRANLVKIHAQSSIVAEDAAGALLGEVPALLAEVDRLWAAVERVRAVHWRTPEGDCAHCSIDDTSYDATPYPCPTIQALED